MNAARRRIFVPWSEWRALALEDYAANDGACLPAEARERLDGGDVRIVLANDECGQVASYRPVLDHDGRAFVRRLRDERRVAA